MKAALIAVGSELLYGERRDTNAEWLARELQQAGCDIGLRVQVGDNEEAIAAAVRYAIADHDLVLLTGGLGPTEDDRTREALARALGRPLERDPEQSRRLRELFARFGRPYTDDQDRQALRPRGADWIDNPRGSAPGIRAELTGRVVCALPGVPAEMRAMFRAAIAPRLAASGRGTLAQRVLKVGGRAESSVDRQLRDLYDGPGVTVTILAGHEGIELHLRVRAADSAAARRRLQTLEEAIAERLGADLFGRDRQTLAAVVADSLTRRGATVATAESCTGGMLGAALTAVPGASAWYRGGFVVYDDALKRRLVGVAPELLERHGAVSAEVAEALARGARERCESDLALAVTGIAGPGGGSPDKPVGLVYLALADTTTTRHWRLQTFGDRALIRQRTVNAALDRLRRRLLEDGGA